MWFCSHPVWLFFVDSIFTCGCFRSENLFFILFLFFVVVVLVVVFLEIAREIEVGGKAEMRIHGL